MISDILSEAVSEIDRYLTDKVFKGVYSGELKEQIIVLRNNMEEMRKELDDPCKPNTLFGKTYSARFNFSHS